MEWINVKDRLPPEDIRVLTYEDGDVLDPYRIDYIFQSSDPNSWVCRLNDELSRVTHWMELPTPPIIDY